jgi:hypothetical protein
VRYCQNAAREELAGYLAEICRDEGPFLPPPWLPDLAECLNAMIGDSDSVGSRPSAETAVSRAIRSSLDFTHRQRCLSVVWGGARIGKTHSSRAWVERHVGVARFVEVPSSNDILTLLRSVAAALGIVGGERLPRCELRAKIFETLRDGGPTLVLDEAHRMWPDIRQDRGLPRRVEWLMEVVNMGTPVALVALPDFWTRMAQTAKTGWRSEQFIGRVKQEVELPALTTHDFRSVTKTLLPEANARGIDVIATYAELSNRGLGGIERVVLRAKYIAQQSGRQNVSFNDVESAFKESVAPSETALKAALSKGEAKAGGRGKQRSATAAAHSILGAIRASAAPSGEPAQELRDGRPCPLETAGRGETFDDAPRRVAGGRTPISDADALGLQGPCIDDSEAQETCAEMAPG